MSLPKICCPKCDGSGEIALFPELAEVYNCLRKAGAQSAPQLLKRIKAKVHPTAMNQRLERLRRLGLVERTRMGREWQYAAK